MLKRAAIVVCFLLMALTLRAVTPEFGLEKLRKLVRLPTVMFQTDWTFDPERGFSLGSANQDARAKITHLRKELTGELADAALYEDLGDLYSSINDTRNARDAWYLAAGLFRKRVELQPDDPILLAGLGRALQNTGQPQEAESVLRQAARLGPTEWTCWTALGRFLDSQARSDIEDPSKPAPGSDSSSGAVTDRPASAAVSLAQRRLDEAGDCFDKAVAAAPDAAGPYFRRGMHRCLRSFLLNQIHPTSDTDPFNGCFSPESLADLRQSTLLDPRDYCRIAGTALFEIYTVSAKKGRVNWAGFSLDSLPDKSQRSIRGAMTQLENLGDDSDPHFAAGALEVLGVLQGPVLHERRVCVANLRRALALDPSREQAWDMLAGTLAQAQNYDDLLSVCTDEVRQRDIARSHLLLAKAFEKLKQWGNCEDELRIAVQQDENNFTATLALGSLLLKQRQNDASVLSEANGWLARAESIIAKMPKAQRTQQQLIELTLSRSIYFALSGDVETARQWANAVIQVDKENLLAREILAAMDF